MDFALLRAQVRAKIPRQILGFIRTVRGELAPGPSGDRRLGVFLLNCPLRQGKMVGTGRFHRCACALSSPQKSVPVFERQSRVAIMRRRALVCKPPILLMRMAIRGGGIARYGDHIFTDSDVRSGRFFVAYEYFSVDGYDNSAQLCT